MYTDSKRRALVDSLKRITPEMQARLEDLKAWGEDELKRLDFVWHILLQSFSTWGGGRGHEGLIGNQGNYSRVTFEALSGLDDDERSSTLEEVFLAAKVRYAVMKADLMARNYDLVEEMGGPVEATRQALAQDGREAKIAFMKRFHGIGPKYARNIWMDAYHLDFRDTIAIDLRIQKITGALGHSFIPNEYDKHERFYQEIAEEAGLRGWELDRLLYEYTDHFLSDIAANEEYAWETDDIRTTKRSTHEGGGLVTFDVTDEEDKTSEAAGWGEKVTAVLRRVLETEEDEGGFEVVTMTSVPNNVMITGSDPETAGGALEHLLAGLRAFGFSGTLAVDDATYIGGVNRYEVEV